MDGCGIGPVENELAVGYMELAHEGRKWEGVLVFAFPRSVNRFSGFQIHQPLVEQGAVF